MRERLSPRGLMSLLYNGQRAIDVIAAALELGLLRALDDGPVTLRELSQRLGLVPGRLHKFLDCLESLGFIEIRQDTDDLHDASYFSREPLTEAAEAVVGAQSVERERDRHCWRALYQRLPAVLRGEPGIPTQAFTWPPQTGAQAAGFETSMAATIGPIAEAFVRAQPVLFPHPHSPAAGCRRLLEVGGGDGTLGLALVRHFSELRVDVYNLPVTGPLVAHTAGSAAGRLGFVGGDFLVEDLPRGYDAMSFVRVLFDWPGDVVKRLLQKALAALPAGGRLFICEEFRSAEQLATEFFWQYFLIGVDTNPYRLREREYYLRALEEVGFSEISVCPGRVEIIAATRP